MDERFRDVLELSTKVGELNTLIRYDQYENVILEEKRDFLNSLTWVKRRNRKGEEEDVFDEEELAAMEIREEEVRRWYSLGQLCCCVGRSVGFRLRFYGHMVLQVGC